jgi:hypothetical protein
MSLASLRVLSRSNISASTGPGPLATKGPSPVPLRSFRSLPNIAMVSYSRVPPLPETDSDVSGEIGRF